MHQVLALKRAMALDLNKVHAALKIVDHNQILDLLKVMDLEVKVLPAVLLHKVMVDLKTLDLNLDLNKVIRILVHKIAMDLVLNKVQVLAVVETKTLDLDLNKVHTVVDLLKVEARILVHKTAMALDLKAHNKALAVVEIKTKILALDLKTVMAQETKTLVLKILVHIQEIRILVLKPMALALKTLMHQVPTRQVPLPQVPTHQVLLHQQPMQHQLQLLRLMHQVLVHQQPMHHQLQLLRLTHQVLAHQQLMPPLLQPLQLQLLQLQHQLLQLPLRPLRLKELKSQPTLLLLKSLLLHLFL
jgi:hypothetical protein